MDNRPDYSDADAELDEGYFTGSSQEVATALGVTTAGLRRLADIYDTAYPPLRRDEQQNNRRLWTRAAIERLKMARQLVQAEKARSIKAALESIKKGNASHTEAPLAIPQAPAQDGVLLAVLEHMQRLEARVEAVQRQLEAPKEVAQPTVTTADDGPLVRAARWLEARLRGRS